MCKLLTIQKTEIQIHQERKRDRIQHFKKKAAILNLEEHWERYAFARLEKSGEAAADILLRHVTVISLIKQTARGFYLAWKKNSRLTFHDFESTLYERAWLVIRNYSWNDDFYLYEQLKNAVKQASIDLLRSEGLVRTKQEERAFFHAATGFGEQDLVDPFNVEADVVTRIFIEQVLTGQDLEVARLLVEHSDLSLAEICDEVRIKHKQQAKRIVARIRAKLVAAEFI